MFQILEVANGGVTKKIEIMYKANLSYAQLKEYVMVLTESDLLRYDLDTQIFMTTEKGLRFLDAYNQMDAVMKRGKKIDAGLTEELTQLFCSASMQTIRLLLGTQFHESLSINLETFTFSSFYLLPLLSSLISP